MPGSKWVIVGGESGPGARTINPEWVRDILIGNCLAGLSRTAVPPTNLLLARARAPSGLEDDGEQDQRWRHYDHHGPRDHLNRCPLPILQREALANEVSGPPRTERRLPGVCKSAGLPSSRFPVRLGSPSRHAFARNSPVTRISFAHHG